MVLHALGLSFQFLEGLDFLLYSVLEVVKQNFILALLEFSLLCGVFPRRSLLRREAPEVGALARVDQTVIGRLGVLASRLPFPLPLVYSFKFTMRALTGKHLVYS